MLMVGSLRPECRPLFNPAHWAAPDYAFVANVHAGVASDVPRNMLFFCPLCARGFDDLPAAADHLRARHALLDRAPATYWHLINLYARDGTPCPACGDVLARDDQRYRHCRRRCDKDNNDSRGRSLMSS
jgi:hypothetical protein